MLGGCSDSSSSNGDETGTTSSSSGGSASTSDGSTSGDPATTTDATSTTTTDPTTDGSSTTGESSCEPGTYGADCSGVCACDHGECDDGREGTGTCSCDAGWSGAACDACADDHFGEQCEVCSCANGVCDDGIDGSGTCACDEGWTGTSCDHDCNGGTVNPDGTCTAILESTEDTFVCSDDYADMNFGDSERTPRAVGQQNDFTGNQIGRALFKFDLSSLPEGTTVTDATLRLREYDNFAGFPMDVRLAPTTTDWVEGTVTWNTQPTPGPSLGAQTVDCCGDDHDWDVLTTITTALGNGETDVAYQLASDDEATIGGVRWFFREGDGVVLGSITGQAPRIRLIYAVP